MPNLKQNIGVLRNGVQKRRTQNAEPQEESMSGRLPIRDHYERYEQFMKRQYPKRRQDRFVEEDVARQAEVADRDTPIGVLDTLVREFVVFWMPEVEVFLLADAFDDTEVEREAYLKYADGLEENMMVVSERVDCAGDGAATKLRDALQERVMYYLADLFEACKDVLDDKEKPGHDPTKRSSRRVQQAKPATPRKAMDDLVSEARTLNSSLAWDLSDKMHLAPPTPSARLRHLSPIRQLDYADAADNGQAWGAPEASFKEQKVEFEFTSKLKFTATETRGLNGGLAKRKKGVSKSSPVDLTASDDENAERSAPGAYGSDEMRYDAVEDDRCPPRKKQRTDEGCVAM